MAKALVLVQLTLLLAACFTAVPGNEAGNEAAEEAVALSAQSPSPLHHSPSYPPSESPKYPPHHHHHHHRKIQPPVHSPAYSPVQHPPSYPLPKRSLLAVQGVVFCKACNYSGVDTLLGATPLAGASVKLECNNTKKPLVQEGKTDKNGYFYIMAPKSITTFGSHKCKVFLSSSPVATCNKPTDLHYGLQGAILMPQKLPSVQAPLTSPAPSPRDAAAVFPYELFTVGPFAFEPQTKCPH